ncbi:DHA2 family efflux MFS transporter permease subunit [Sporolactobacillus sp. KGMB 08714]|uniref:DHA2 family efflux MFS transporter permease subunit n=1 Tax=Sporolactobacillus sp. KGMB 08714 TaxID=3064704 RepID=UPI002FBE1197
MKTNESKRMPILLGLLISAFIGMFGETAINIALTPLMKALHVSAPTVQWLSTGYLLIVGILVPVSGLLIRWFTTRQLLFSALAAFIAGTFIAAMAQGFPMLLTGRLIQGIATGILIPLLFNTVMAIYPPQKRGTAFGMVGLILMFSPAIGPTVAGLILNALGWQWIFWLMLPFLILALVVSIIFCKDVNTVTRPEIDPLSIFLSTLGSGGIVAGCSFAGDLGWTSTAVLFLLAIGVISIILFSIKQLKMENPMLNIRGFKIPMFTVGIVEVVTSFSIIMSAMLLLPMYWQGGKLLSAAIAGLLLLPGGIVNGLVSVISGRLYDLYGPKWLVKIGAALNIIAAIMFVNIRVSSSYVYVIGANILLMIGMPLVITCSQTNGLNALPKELSPDGSAIMNTGQQICGAIAIALTTTFLAAGENVYRATIGHSTAEMLTNGVKYGFTFTLVLAIIGFVLSLFMKHTSVLALKPGLEQEKN